METDAIIEPHKETSKVVVSIPNLPSPEAIQADIDKLVQEVAQCVAFIRAYKKDIKAKREEQAELRRLVDGPGDYEVEALRRNVGECDDHVKMFEAAQDAERDKIAKFNHIIEDLKERKELSELMDGGTQ